ncbi:nitroreductase/quinone reductase family protein [Nocardia asteroides]|uniref:nitroreductase/quinone reductase family protein n=1 Tax=Nocardia asteroides TaxID=1824 RepID=UPI001E372388|nr:nitroreductase/quinone reductase family protein [Nocardia asteroides]UGT62802.1 nitroreductase family deazaflavin-dependent oxidoreductase [Nocardia asteroides]
MPPEFTFRATNTAHRLLTRLTFGRFGHRIVGMPSLELTTVGRRSGKEHAVLLTAPIVEDGGYVVVASKAGEHKHPAWYHNLLAHPEVTVSVQGGPRTPMRARVADPAERAELWPRVTAGHPIYANYQTRTDREIPLVLLTPRDGA